MNKERIKKVKRVEEILKWLPVIREIIRLGGNWNQLKGICEPLHLSDTAFRDNPTLKDFLVQGAYWVNSLKDGENRKEKI